MLEKPVCIIGCGPIGLAGALLLSRLDVPVLIVEKRSELNTHPRSRFVDTNTMELMRLLGIEKEVEQTGLGPDWTAYNRWLESLTGQEYAAIPSPTFHTVPRPTSPCLPVMTCQDYVEVELLNLVKQKANIDCRFSTEALNVEQNADFVSLTLRDTQSGEEHQVQADYLIGADGPHSRTRSVIDTELASDPIAMYSQDVLFDADLSAQVGDRKAGLLHCVTSGGVSTLQPLNGVRRWRIQIFKPQPDDLSMDEIIHRIHLAVGSSEVELDFKSIGTWQGTPGCVSKFSDGRIFLAGDAAHISVPTGGMGNNIGFAGIRNLTWKLAYVIQGNANPDILDTYEEEMKPVAMKRIAHGLNTTQGVGTMIRAIYGGEDHSDGIYASRMYADYDGIILGHEMESPLIAKDPDQPPTVENPVTDFVACVRSGRRAPHIWVDEDQQTSILDWFGTSYALIAGKDVETIRWQDIVDEISQPIRLNTILGGDPNGTYKDDELVLVRPDGVIADHWRDLEDAATERLIRVLPGC